MRRLIEPLVEDWHRTLFATLVLAVVIRAIFIFSLQDGFYFPDSIEYSRAAASLAGTGQLDHGYNRPPGYAVFLAGIYKFFGQNILTIRIIESLLGGWLAVIIAMIGKRVGGQIVGGIAGLLWALYPLGVFIVGLLYPTNLVALLLASGVLCFIPGSDKGLSPKRLFVAGIILGLAALTVPVVIATLAMVSIWIVCHNRERRVRLVCLLLIGVALTVIPWMIRDLYVYNRLVLIEPRIVEHLPRIDGAQKNDRERKFEAIREHPSFFVARYVHEFLHFWKPYPDHLAMDSRKVREEAYEVDHRIVKETIFSQNNLVTVVNLLSTGPLFIFAIIGTITMWLEPAKRHYLTLLWAIILSFAGVYSLFYAKTRYRIPVEPYITILSAYGLRKTWLLVAAHFTNSSKVRDGEELNPHLQPVNSKV